MPSAAWALGRIGTSDARAALARHRDDPDHWSGMQSDEPWNEDRTHRTKEQAGGIITPLGLLI